MWLPHTLHKIICYNPFFCAYFLFLNQNRSCVTNHFIIHALRGLFFVTLFYVKHKPC